MDSLFWWCFIYLFLPFLKMILSFVVSPLWFSGIHNPLTLTCPSPLVSPAPSLNCLVSRAAILAEQAHRGSSFLRKLFIYKLAKPKWIRARTPGGSYPRPFFPGFWSSPLWCFLDAHGQFTYSSSVTCILHIATVRELLQSAIKRSMLKQTSCRSLLNHMAIKYNKYP